jgi:hypothetical protein
VGSFLNVASRAFPAESVVTPNSYCPPAWPIRWYDNTPLMSYLLLHGGGVGAAGRRDLSPIPRQVEIITAKPAGCGMGTIWPQVGLRQSALLCTLLVVLIFTDLTFAKSHTSHHSGPRGLLLSLLAPVDDRPLAWLSPQVSECLCKAGLPALRCSVRCRIWLGLFLWWAGFRKAATQGRFRIWRCDPHGNGGHLSWSPLTYATILRWFSWLAPSR